jgi:hypothetical protein
MLLPDVYHGGLMLGTGEPDQPYKAESFVLNDVRYYVRRAARRLELFAANLPTGSLASPRCVRVLL